MLNKIETIKNKRDLKARKCQLKIATNNELSENTSIISQIMCVIWICTQLAREGRVIDVMTIKYVYYKHTNVYALYYRSNNTLYYNKNFKGKCKLIIFN